MKNQIKQLLLIFLLFNTLIIHSQDVSGVITYKATIDKDEMLKKIRQDKETPEKLKATIIEAISSSDSITFKLIFKDKESLFFSEEKKWKMKEKKINLTSVQADENNIYYTNLETKEQFRQNSNFNDILINIDPYEWDLLDETKKIGHYTCKKATTVMVSEGRAGKISKKITAWYTTEIPLNFGIKGFNGLPGITLELNIDNNLKFHFINMKLNPEEEIEIKEPKGKKMSLTEFNQKLKDYLNRKH